MKKSVYLRTMGCQMNERDAEEVIGMLTAQGYEVAEQAEKADVILLNTCSVREHAEERAYGKMGELAVLKKERPELVLGIIGCMAKLHQQAIFKRLPAVDLVAGPAELYDLPYLLAEIQQKRQKSEIRDQRSEGIEQEEIVWSEIRNQKSEVRRDGSERTNLTSDVRHLTSERVVAIGRHYRPLNQKPIGDYRSSGVTAFVTIMEGCDKACTYCIVPRTRGQEISRPAQEIIDEINRLAELGYKEVTLLGQNVNSYGKRFPDGSGYKGPLGRLRLLESDLGSLLDFPELLRRIDHSFKEGDSPLRGQSPVRVRFTTSHPFDATERLFETMRDCPSVCEYLHLPVQSGSNRILRAMRRGYTVRHYLEKIEQLRHRVPEVGLSTDIIVGFPGECDEDFQATIRLMRDVRYDNAYIFKYSPRPGTDAAAKEDDIPQAVKEERNQILLSLQREIEQEKKRALEGKTVEILVEGPGKFAGQWFGRTRDNHGVIVESPENLNGQLLEVCITRFAKHTLFSIPKACLTSSPLSGQRLSEKPQ
ncbi:MAG: MiaB/RimO family radical SAM methylthiotransferase [Candidatus Omnitrophica bacterium]|nr:MiaB/RimO family radical SAM methylthiotransferase [Candidatus Omnitrophota bacterium]